MIFRGTFEYALDAKHRLTVPPKYRPAFAAGVVLALSPEFEPGTPRTLAMWTQDEYDAYAAAALQGVHPMSPKARELKRVLYGNSWELELDSAGRLPIPSTAKQLAGLDKDVTVTGSGECLEVWDRTKYLAYQQDSLSRFPDIAASFDHTP